jgi:hypothetical protein
VTRPPKTDLRAQLLAAAVECSEGDTSRTFSSEELLIAAWRRDPLAWGLRGYEREHPDSNRIHRELDSRGKDQQGIVGQGFLERVRPRTYRLTPKGFAEATLVVGADPERLARLNRVLEAEVTRVIEHPAFVGWLQDPSTPRSFRDVGHFWGVAPGTPARVVRQRLQSVEETLNAALSILDQSNLQEVGDRHGSLLFERNDVLRALDFHREMMRRFESQLGVLTRS